MPTLRQIERRLRAAGVPDPRFDALEMASALTGRTRASLLADPELPLGGEGLEAAVRRREAREPLQYILGEWSFMGHVYRVGPGCLIPRPDTETTVETALALLPPGGRAADLCTGSGCIAAELVLRGGAAVTAVELSPAAAALAAENFARLGVADRVRLLTADVRDDPLAGEEPFDRIVANPPYVGRDEMADLAPEIGYEPAMALTDGGDGLSLLSDIIRICPARLSPGGHLVVEHGFAQGAAVRRMAERRGLTARTLRDLGGNERCTVIGLSGTAPD